MCAGGGVQNCMEDGLHNFSIVETVSGPPGVVQFLIAGYNEGYRDGRYFYLNQKPTFKATSSYKRGMFLNKYFNF